MENHKPLILIRDLQKDNPEYSWISAEFESKVREYFDIVCLAGTEQDPSILERVKGVCCIPCDAPLFAEMVPRLPRLEAVTVLGAGYDNYYHLFEPLGIPIANTPPATTKPTADLAMALVLKAACHVTQGMHMAQGVTPRMMTMRELQDIPGVGGKTMGIVGMGRIGFEIAKRAKVFSMTILYYNRQQRPSDEEDEVSAEYCASLSDMLPRCDYVVLVCALTSQTRAMIGRQELQLMKKSAILVNVSRGHVINQEALVEALASKVIRYAALDVTYPEPLPAGHPLLRLDNVLITPHLGGGCGQAAWDGLCQNVIENLKAALIDHTPMPYLIKP